MHTDRRYHIIGACSCWGAQIRACEEGPETLAKEHIVERLRHRGVILDEIEMLYPEKKANNSIIPLSQSLPLIRNFNLQLAHAVRRTLKSGLFPVVLGGDHSIAVGTWNGFSSPLGLLWIDAHMDAHTPETTPSGAYHGMPLAALLGYGAREMAHLIRKEAVLQSQNVALIGVRSFEEGEAHLLQELNVRIYFMEEIRQRGLKVVLSEAIEHITQHVPSYGISLDLDVFSPEEVPGVGSPEAGGIRPSELISLLSPLHRDHRWIGFEMVEFNPELDIDHKTSRVAYEILTEVMQNG